MSITVEYLHISHPANVLVTLKFGALVEVISNTR